jgi:hypothetical protein
MSSNLKEEDIKIPKRIFIVPYRNRVQHKFFFSKYMSFILEDKDDYEIFFCHQCDARTFNRGAMKNIGFIAAMDKYPNHYKDITFIFNDVDTIPFYKIFDYETSHGVVKHHYGFKYALGGIIVMKGYDFEQLNGFPCFWGWGMEDNVLQKRCDILGLKVDRSQFYNIGSPEILQLFDGISRIISKKDPWRGEYDNGIDGLRSITKLKYSIDDKSNNPNDNIFTVDNPNIKIINISTFLTHIPFGSEEYYSYDLREPKRKIINPDKIRETKRTVTSTNDWSDIPYYPTTLEKKENVARYLIKMGKQIPQNLLQQIADGKRREIENDSYNKFEITNPHNQEPYNESNESNESNVNYYENNVNNFNNSNSSNSQIPNVYQPMVQYGHTSKIQTNMANQKNFYRPPPPPNKYSPQYAAYIGAKPRAQATARIRLGGAY